MIISSHLILSAGVVAHSLLLLTKVRATQLISDKEQHSTSLSVLMNVGSQLLLMMMLIAIIKTNLEKVLLNVSIS